jgi:hypothetical protein
VISVWAVVNSTNHLLDIHLDEELANNQADDFRYTAVSSFLQIRVVEFKPEITPKVMRQILKIAEEA